MNKLRNHLTNPNHWIILLVLLSTPFVFRAAGNALGERDNQVRQWLPRGFDETKSYDWFLDHFGSEEFTLVSWEGATVKDERLTTLASALRKHVPNDAPSESENKGWFRKIVTGPELLSSLRDGQLDLSHAAATNRLRGSLIGVDGKTTGLLVFLEETGRKHRHEVVDTIRTEATNVGIAVADLRLGGPTIDSVALDQESERSRSKLALISLALGTLAAWKCLRNVRLVAVVLLTALYCGAATLAWVSFFGDKLNLVMVTMPTLVYVLAISGAIHVAHYYQSALRKNNRRDAIQVALKAGWLPCSLTTITTAIGLGSLVVSNVGPVRMFGFYSALGVLTSLPIILLLLPAVLAIVLPEIKVSTDRGEEGAPERSAKRSKERPSRHSLWLAHHLSRFVGRRHTVITALGVVLMGTSLVGLTRLETSVKLTNFFSPDSKVISDYRWLEENLAPLVPIELVLRIPHGDELNIVDHATLTGKVQKALADLPEVEGAMSAATFTPTIPNGSGLRQHVKRKVINKALEDNMDELFAAGYVGDDCENQLWRVSARVNALNDLDYGLFLDSLKDAVEPVLEEFRATSGEEVEVVYTGVVPLIYKAQRVLLADLSQSFLLAFGIIAVVMFLMMNGAAAGLVTMIPNMFPAVIVFGMLGWFGIVCDIGTVITASVALGIAVDDTIHFMSWFRRGLERGLDRSGALRESYRRCGTAMIQTTIICGLGMLGFAFSDFAPTAKFATVMGMLLVTALVGDLLFLPAILTSRLGKVFEPRSVAV